MAWHDALTGLPNRRSFEDRVEQELVRSRRVGEPVCMFFVDLDHFKSVNDTKGHAAGDDLIQQVSQRLVDTVRRQDTVARVGGDEFAILLPGLSDQLSIDQLAQRSLEAMSRPFIVFGEEVETSASIGIAMAPEHGDSYDELLSRADEAMYRAKGRGRNAFQMYSGSRGQRLGRHDWPSTSGPSTPTSSTPSTTTSSSCSTSRTSTSAPPRWSAWRPWSAGATPPSASSSRPRSSPWRSAARSSSPSTPGCSNRRAGSSAPGSTTASTRSGCR